MTQSGHWRCSVSGARQTAVLHGDPTRPVAQSACLVEDSTPPYLDAVILQCKHPLWRVAEWMAMYSRNLRIAALAVATSATFTIGASTGSLLGTFNEVALNQDPSFPRIIFGQGQSASPFFVAEGLENSVFVSYDLASAFPLTTGTVEQTAGSLYFTSLGDLVFSDITSMSFEAVIPGATPLPGAMPLFATGLSALGFLGWRRKKKATTAAA
jgi:hypothetical protein